MRECNPTKPRPPKKVGATDFNAIDKMFITIDGTDVPSYYQFFLQKKETDKRIKRLLLASIIESLAIISLVASALVK